MPMKLINRLIIATILCSVNLIAYGEVMEGEGFAIGGLKGRYYENGGCIYFIGDFTEKEIIMHQQKYEKRMTKRARQVDGEIQRKHEIEIEKIRAQALRDYLIAQDMPLREIADAMRNLKIRQNVNIGDITSSSSSSIGDITNTSSSISEGSNATGTGGTLTNTNTNSARSWGCPCIKCLEAPLLETIPKELEY